MTDKTGIQALITAAAGTVLILSAVLYPFLYFQKNRADTGAGEISGLTVTGIISINGSAESSEVLGNGEPPQELKQELPEREEASRESAVTESNQENHEKTFEETLPKQTSVRTVKKNPKTAKSTGNPHRISERTPKAEKKTAARNAENSQNKNSDSEKHEGVRNAAAGVGEPDKEGSTGSAESKASPDRDVYGKAYGMLVNRARQLHTYPYQARKRGIEGKGLLTVTINVKGIVTGYSLNRSTGSTILDRAMDNVGEKLKGFDTGIRGWELKVNIPLVYRLRNDA